MTTLKQRAIGLESSSHRIAGMKQAGSKRSATEKRLAVFVVDTDEKELLTPLEK